MKICLINNIFGIYKRGGGTERITEIIEQELKHVGHEVFVITTKPYFDSKWKQKIEHNTYYINSLFLSLNKIPSFFRIFWHIIDMFDFRVYFSIKKILRKENPDLIITNNLKGLSFLIPHLIKKLGIKHIHILHDIQLIHPSGLVFFGKEKQIESIFAKIYTSLNRYLFQSPDYVVSPSAWLQKIHTENEFFIASKKEILPNPAILYSTKTIDEKNFENNSHANFIYVGQIEKHKGVSFLIDSFKIFSEKFESQSKKIPTLTIIGSGSKLAEISKKSKNFDNIKILGQKTTIEVKEKMLNSDFIIVPSLCYENSPTVIYEAVSANLPVIASNIGGIPELIKKFGGLLFQPGNEGDLIYQLQKAIKKYPEIKKQALKSRELINEYSLSSYIKQLLNIIKN